MPKPDERPGKPRPERKGAGLSRIEAMRRDKMPVQMPPNPAPVIIARLMEVGLTEATGMGVVPLSWVTIDAWCNRTGVDLPPWEARLLRHLSAEYVAESRRAESEHCPPPWRGEITLRARQVEQEQLEEVLG